MGFWGGGGEGGLSLFGVLQGYYSLGEGGGWYECGTWRCVSVCMNIIS